MNRSTLVLPLLLAVALAFASCSRSVQDHSGHGGTETRETAAEVYTCPMHPQVQKDRPGVCPICGMELVKAGHGHDPNGTMEADTASGGVDLGEDALVLAGVATTRVTLEPVAVTLTAVGTLVAPDPQKSMVSARFNGRIEEVFVPAPGSVVKHGDPLFDIYSPDLIQAGNDYLQASAAAPPLAAAGATAAKARLRLMGLTEAQIRSIDSTGTVPLVSTYYSPSRGTVMDKRIVVGSYVSEGETLFELADLSTLWDLAEVPASEASEILVGGNATISFPSGGYAPVRGRVTFMYPVADPQSRTVKVRVVVDNARGVLRPNMFTDVSFSGATRKAVVVPVGAVLRTGKRDLVYVRSPGGNRFEPREVGLGIRSRDNYEVLWGITEGEEVVSEGGFLVDSESQLRTGSGSGHQHQQ